MPKATQPELKKVRKVDISKLMVQYMDKRLFVQLNGSRKVVGVLRGYDVSFHSIYWFNVQVFLNVVLDEAYEEKTSGQRIPMGTVVIRGNSVVMIRSEEHTSELQSR